MSNNRDQLAEMLHETFLEAIKRAQSLHGNGMLSVPYQQLSRPDKDWWRKRGDAVKKLVEGIRFDWPGENCRNCGAQNRLGFNVPDELWREIVPPELQDHCLCLNCFDGFAEEKGVDYSGEIELFWAGFGKLPIGVKWTKTVQVGTINYQVVIEPDLEFGGYVVECPAIPGCVSQGESHREALWMIKDAIALCLEVYKERGIAIGEEREVDMGGQNA